MLGSGAASGRGFAPRDGSGTARPGTEAANQRDSARQRGPPDKQSSDDLVTIPFFVVDEDGNIPVPGETKDRTGLYDMRTWAAKQELVPVRAPDGSHVEWGEYSRPTGSASVKCVNKGTHVSVQYDGLIPKGLYTVWNVVFHTPGFQGTLESIQKNLVGVSALGAPEGGQNVFRASASGQGHVAATTPARSPVYAVQADPKTGEPIPPGTIGNCTLTDEFEWHVVAAYHLDGKTYGPLPGPAGTEVEQVGFIFRNGGP